MERTGVSGKVRCFVTFEKTTGRILTVHYFGTIAGGAERSHEDAHLFARRDAELSSKLAIESIDAILADRHLDKGARYRVDPLTRELVADSSGAAGIAARYRWATKPQKQL